MPAPTIPESHLDLFKKKAFAHLATLMPKGQPQVTPVWVDYDGRHVLVNTAEGRQKDKNLQRDGRVALSILDPDNPYRYLEVRGRVAERTLERCGRAHRLVGDEISRQGKISVSATERGPRHLPDRAGARQ